MQTPVRNIHIQIWSTVFSIYLSFMCFLCNAFLSPQVKSTFAVLSFFCLFKNCSCLFCLLLNSLCARNSLCSVVFSYYLSGRWWRVNVRLFSVTVLGFIHHSWYYQSKQLIGEEQSLFCTINVHPSSWSHHLNRSVNNSRSLFCYSIFFVLPFTGHILLLGLTSFFGEEQSLFSCSIFTVLPVAGLIPMLGLIILNSLSVKNNQCSFVLYFLFSLLQDSSFCWVSPFWTPCRRRTVLVLLFYDYWSLYWRTHPYSWVSSFRPACRRRPIIVLLFYIYCSPYCWIHSSVGSLRSKQLVGEEQSLFCCSMTTDLSFGGPIPSWVSSFQIACGEDQSLFCCSTLHLLFSLLQDSSLCWVSSSWTACRWRTVLVLLF